MEGNSAKYEDVPAQEVRYSPTVEQLLLGVSGDGYVRELVGFIFFFVVIGIAMLMRFHYLYVPLGLALIFLTIGLASFPALAQPLPKLKWDQNSITFPFACWPVLGANTKTAWRKISRINFVGYFGANYAPKDILITLNNGKSFKLSIDGFRKKDLEQLLLSIKAFAPHVQFSEDPDSLKLGIDTSKGPEKKMESPTHTSIWLSDLNRIAPTVFVPMDTGDKLQDNMIEVIGQIATGGLSAIYLVNSKVYKLSVLKESIIPANSDEATTQKVLEMFKREANILAQLDHPRIVKVFDYFVEDDRHYLLMEFIDGTNLRKVVSDRGPQKEEIVIRWAKEMLDILSYLHKQTPPVVHRDFTPDNLILENDGSITLIDFGAANHCLTTVTGTIVGKTAYMPIEQFQGKPNRESDIYAFAKTIQYLLTGKDPEPFSSYDLLANGHSVSRQLNSLLNTCTGPSQCRPDLNQVISELEIINIIVRRHA